MSHGKQLGVFMGLLLYVIIIACFDIPSVLIEKLMLPLPLFDRSFTLMAPLCAIGLIVILLLRSQKEGVWIRIMKMDVCFMAMIIIWAMIEYIDKGERFLSHNLLSYGWLFFFLYILRTVDQILPIKDRLIVVTNHVVLFLVMLQFANYLGIVGDPGMPWKPFLEKPTPFHVNISSYWALLGVILNLFYLPEKAGMTQRNMFRISLLAYLMLIILNRTIGAVFILGAVLVIKAYFLYERSECIRLTKRLKRISAAAVIVLSVIATAVGNGTDSAKSIQLFGRPLSLSDQSINLRYYACKASFEEFLGHPFLGIGPTQFEKIRVDGMISHTHLVNILTIYGLVGFMFYLLWIVSLFPPRIHRIDRLLVIILFIVGMLCIEPYIYWFYSVLIYIAISQQYRDPSTCSDTQG